MGLRFQRRIRILPGVYINLSKSGVSASVGGKGSTINLSPTGRRMITLGIPGTGLSYRTQLSTGILIILVAIAAIVGIAYLINPTLITAALHWWQPKWF